MNMKMKRAFTLAELLVVIAVVGITTALAIPNLSKNIDEDKNAMKVKSTFGMLQTAVQTMANEKGAISEIMGGNEVADKNTRVGEQLRNYLKSPHSCGTTISSCLTETISDNTTFAFTLKDGTSVAVSECQNPLYAVKDTQTQVVTSSFKPVYCRIYFDINGLDGPNLAGMDYFNFYITNDGDTYFDVPNVDSATGEYLPDIKYVTNTTTGALEESPFTDFADGQQLRWIMTIGNMEYLKLKTVNNKKVCPNNNSITLNWQTRHTCD